ncbi:MAG TPA: hypothetical protein VHT68_16615 [Pseudolabrys sp.]|jgi:hypothetical protein|nr:hypothetical protein [Pseudolabrys sp.]
MASEITAKEAKACWAYSEITSERYGPAFRTNLAPEIVTLADQGVPFAKIAAEHHDALIEVLSKYARNAGFINNLDSSPAYKKVALTKDQLLKLWALWTFSPPDRTQSRPYAVFHRNPGEGPKDPRTIAAAIPNPDDLPQKEPGIVMNGYGRPILIEGYLRSQIFMNSTDPSRRFEVWWPTNIPAPADKEP